VSVRHTCVSASQCRRIANLVWQHVASLSIRSTIISNGLWPWNEGTQRAAGYPERNQYHVLQPISISSAEGDALGSGVTHSNGTRSLVQGLAYSATTSVGGPPSSFDATVKVTSVSRASAKLTCPQLRVLQHSHHAFHIPTIRSPRKPPSPHHRPKHDSPRYRRASNEPTRKHPTHILSSPQL
jgi:hypothetical protein